MDGTSGLFGSSSTGAAGDDTAVINTDDLLGGSSGAAATPVSTPGDDAAIAAVGQIGDPLAVADDADVAADPTEETAVEDDIVPNETITTNDRSKVGDVKPEEEQAASELFSVLPPEPEEEPEIVPEIIPQPQPPQPEPEPEVPFASELKFKLPGVDDPEKVAFIKTYTQEFDDALKRATGAAEAILDAIDKAVHEHSPDITVPDAAEEFLAKKPADNKVEKFEDAREIVHEVLARAADAKVQSAKAAEEAARIYDEVQAFKKETEEKIAELNAA